MDWDGSDSRAEYNGETIWRVGSYGYYGAKTAQDTTAGTYHYDKALLFDTSVSASSWSYSVYISTGSYQQARTTSLRCLHR